MSVKLSSVVEAGQLIGEREGKAAPITLLQSVLQPLAANLGSRPCQQLVPIYWAYEIVVRSQIEPFGKTRQIPVLGDKQDRKLAEGFVRATLGNEPQRIAARYR